MASQRSNGGDDPLADGSWGAPPTPSTGPFDPVHELRVDRGSETPLYLQIARQLEEAIVTGRLPPGERIPNELDLVDDLGLSRPTLRQAIAYLVDKGLVVRKRGVGTQVVMSQVRRPLQLSSLYDDLTSAGQRPTTKVLALETVASDETVAEALGLTPGEPVVRVRRLRSAAAEPIAVMTNYLPRDLAAFDEVSLATHGLYALLRRAGVHLKVASQTIGAASADAEQAGLLHEPRGAALLTMTRTAFDDTGMAVEHGRHVYRASRYSFELTLVER